MFKNLVSILKKSVSKQKLRNHNIFDVEINAINGKPIQLSKFKGKFLLFVNVASKCGFTPQYEDLQALYERYKENLEIIGVPCNQFGGQEPDNANKIESFCKTNYGVSFTITEKIHVKNKNKHPLYIWLTEKSHNGVKNSSVQWNFQKYLIDPEGELIDYFLTSTKPTSSKITKYFN
ncbi:glutathione peroxidase [Seonamhaeicola sp. MEBiC1930]|uniref:glutathione peroxidase n=1 Tax=Seonamhaeicola sp. MEBiC01930 TaxID=2976768 RepID=UPI003252485E